MAPTFFSQCAAGILLVLSASDLKTAGWKYLRLMALVSIGLAFLAAVLLATREALPGPDPLRWTALTALGVGLVGAGGWLTVLTAQGEAVRPSQRGWTAIAGLACLIASVTAGLRPDITLPGDRAAARLQSVRSTPADTATGVNRPPSANGASEGNAAVGAVGAVAAPDAAAIATTAATLGLGALMLGGVTCGMLLGHRYLTDTDMPIAPLRRLTTIYLVVLALRVVWSLGASWPAWTDSFAPAGGGLWFWIVATVRGGIGLLGAGVFAYMIRDCVKSRATQSATAIFYLSMIFVFLGELAGQYLLRTEGLPV